MEMFDIGLILLLGIFIGFIIGSFIGAQMYFTMREESEMRIINSIIEWV